MNRIGLPIGLFFCLLIITANSQSNFQAGYYINNNGDTVSGLIDNRHWDLHPTQVAFKKSQSAVVEQFSPEFIKGFGVGNVVFISGAISYDDGPYKTNELNHDPSPNMIDLDAFVQVLVKGEKSLYHHKDLKGKDHFFIEANGELTWLYYRRFLNIKKKPGKGISGLYIETVERYKGQLESYLQDCPEINNSITRVSYSKQSLVRLFQSYYAKCNEEEPFQIQGIRNETIFRFNLFAGISNTKINFQGPALPWLANVDYPPSTDLMLGFGTEVCFPRNNFNHSAVFDIYYTSTKTENSYLNYNITDFQTYKHSRFNLSYTKIRTLYQYNYYVGQLTIFANAGLSLGILFNGTNRVVTEKIEYGTTVSETYENAFDELRKLDPGVVGGIGIRYSRLSLKAQYEISKGISTINGLSSITKRYYFTAGFMLFEH